MQAKWTQPGEDFEDAKKIRLLVFVHEQGYAEEMEFDDLDKEAQHLTLYDDQEPVATGRLIEKEPGVYLLGRIAVRQEYRKKGVGAALVREMMVRAQNAGAHLLCVDAQCRAEGFYRALGFLSLGDEHMDGHIPHVHMEYRCP